MFGVSLTNTSVTLITFVKTKTKSTIQQLETSEQARAQIMNLHIHIHTWVQAFKLIIFEVIITAFLLHVPKDLSLFIYCIYKNVFYVTKRDTDVVMLLE